MTQEEAAQRVGKSRSAVTNALRLLGLTPSVRKLVEEGKLSAGHARALVPSPLPCRKARPTPLSEADSPSGRFELLVKRLSAEKKLGPKS